MMLYVRRYNLVLLSRGHYSQMAFIRKRTFKFLYRLIFIVAGLYFKTVKTSGMGLKIKRRKAANHKKLNFYAQHYNYKLQKCSISHSVSLLQAVFHKASRERASRVRHSPSALLFIPFYTLLPSRCFFSFLSIFLFSFLGKISLSFSAP